ncbi:MAG: type I pullulanase, partial [Oscillospiraceae bacterium]|nr:type I pullulanase [Oscillospiraceae bacterium]
FDLMGLLDVGQMRRIRRELDRRFGKGEKLLYGEPWAGGTAAVRPGTRLAHKGNLWALEGIGAFCDNTRDAVKGGLMDERAAGFANGGGLDADALYRCVTGWAGREFPTAEQTITYLSCHDDWTLWDKLVLTLDGQRRFEARTPEVLRANRLAAAINFCCQGRPFLLAGEEFGRTKHGAKNTYNASARLNRLDWQRAWANQELVDYYRGLIALRKRLPAFFDKSPQAAQRVRFAANLGPDCAGICLENAAPWPQVLLLVNAAQHPQWVHLPEGDWQVLADGDSSFVWETTRLCSGGVELPPAAALLLGLHTEQTQ